MIAPSREPMQPPLLVTSDEAAEMLGVSRRFLHDLTAPRGPLPCLRLGVGKRRVLRFAVGDLEEFVEQQRAASCVNSAGDSADNIDVAASANLGMT